MTAAKVRPPASSPPARFGTDRGDCPSDGDRVAELLGTLGFQLLPWQKEVLDVGFELDGAGGLPRHHDVVVSTPRQQGKSVLMFGVILHRLMLLEGQTIRFGAQSRMEARVRLVDGWWPMLRRSPLGECLQLSSGAGMEALRNTRNGSVLRLLSSEESSGHGDAIDLVIVDECWSLDEKVELAVRPATMARPGSQMWFISTAGTAKSLWWRGKVDAGREGDPIYFEWSAPDDADPLDEKVWRAAMPALGRTVPIETVRKDFPRMPSLDAARRAYLNQWVVDDDPGWHVISEEVWRTAEWRDEL